MWKVDVLSVITLVLERLDLTLSLTFYSLFTQASLVSFWPYLLLFFLLLLLLLPCLLSLS